jgi:8-oxo-dGTP pyrophosphatase MutT (NUDIX family)
MAASRFKTDQYDAEHFVESVGAIAIKTSTRKICLIHYVERDEWLLAKGRRNVGESRLEAALREIKEETGYSCRILPLTMTTRAPPAVETGDCPDEPRVHKGVCEPFMFTCRHLEEGCAVKLIWWYIAAIDETAAVECGEEQFNVRLFDFEEALCMLTFENDRQIVRKAIQVFENTRLTPSITLDSSG